MKLREQTICPLAMDDDGFIGKMIQFRVLCLPGYIQDRKEGCNEANQSRFKEVDKTCQDGATMYAICIHSLHSCSCNGNDWVEKL